MSIKELKGLDSQIYEHELDKNALSALKGTPGLEFISKKILEIGAERYYKINYTGSHVKVKDTLFGGLNKLLIECCRTLSIDKIPDLYVEWDYNINAFTIGYENPIIVVTTGSIDLLAETEMKFIIGHELGHIKSGHCLYHMMAQIFPVLGSILGDITLGIGNLLSGGIQLALLNWERMSEFTADRAGLLSCQDYTGAVGAFMKISGVPRRYYGKVSLDGFIEQSKDFEALDTDKLDKAIKILSVLQSSHPWTIMRSSEIIKWVESGEYNKILRRF